MGTPNMLDIVLKDILQAAKPSQEDWEIRFAILSDLQNIVESVESLRGATVEPFGSFVSNLFTRWGDLDISIELPNGSHISSAGRKQKQILLGDLLRALRVTGGCNNLQFIINARVPIIKFRSNRQGISCDVSINNLQGLMKSKVLLWIKKIDSRFHDLVLVVKEWAKAHKINNSKAGTFNSYTLSLLVIFYLQTCIPAILPPLKDIYPGNMADDLRGVRADVENLIAETCDANINRFRSDRSRKVNRKSVPELFIDFLLRFAQMDSWASEVGICTYSGQWERIKDNMRWLPKTCAILVEDPFDQPENSARTVGAKQLIKISEAFLKTHGLLTSKNQNQMSLMTCLASPQVSRHLAKPFILNYSVIPAIPNYGVRPAIPNYSARPAIPNYNGGYFPQIQPQVPRAVAPRPQRQRRSQNVKAGASSNDPIQNGKAGTTSNNPIQNGKAGTSANCSTSRVPTQARQSQQTWRPKNQ